VEFYEFYYLLILGEVFVTLFFTSDLLFFRSSGTPPTVLVVIDFRNDSDRFGRRRISIFDHF